MIAVNIVSFFLFSVMIISKASAFWVRGYYLPTWKRISSRMLSTATASTVSGQDSGSANAVNSDVAAPLPSKVWNIKALKEEVERLHRRTFKKITHLSERFLRESEVSQRVMAMESPTIQELEKCPDPLSTQAEMAEMQKRLRSLEEIRNVLQNVKNSQDDNFQSIVPQIIAFNISDTPPPKQVRGEKKPKGVKPPPRLPYFTYRSLDGIEIRVGREAEDNDQLSCNPELRDDDEWWLHVSGMAGSHVVIRCPDDNVPERFRQTVLDAAMLAIANSKAKNAGGKVPVNLTRCRNVSKPRGAKPGLVYLGSGEIRTINVDVKTERSRLERLKKE